MDVDKLGQIIAELAERVEKLFTYASQYRMHQQYQLAMASARGASRRCGKLGFPLSSLPHPLNHRTIFDLNLLLRLIDKLYDTLEDNVAPKFYIALYL